MKRFELRDLAAVETRLGVLEELRERIIAICGFDNTTVYFTGYSSEGMKHLLTVLRMEKVDFDKAVRDILIGSVAEQIASAQKTLERAEVEL